MSPLESIAASVALALTGLALLGAAMRWLRESRAAAGGPAFEEAMSAAVLTAGHGWVAGHIERMGEEPLPHVVISERARASRDGTVLSETHRVSEMHPFVLRTVSGETVEVTPSPQARLRGGLSGGATSSGERVRRAGPALGAFVLVRGELTAPHETGGYRTAPDRWALREAVEIVYERMSEQHERWRRAYGRATTFLAVGWVLGGWFGGWVAVALTLVAACLAGAELRVARAWYEGARTSRIERAPATAQPPSEPPDRGARTSDAIRKSLEHFVARMREVDPKIDDVDDWWPAGRSVGPGWVEDRDIEGHWAWPSVEQVVFTYVKSMAMARSRDLVRERRIIGKEAVRSSQAHMHALLEAAAPGWSKRTQVGIVERPRAREVAPDGKP